MSLSFSRQTTSLRINKVDVCACLRHTCSLVDREVGRLDVMRRLDVPGRVAMSVQDFVRCARSSCDVGTRFCFLYLCCIHKGAHTSSIFKVCSYGVYLKCMYILQEWVLHFKTKKKVHINTCTETISFWV